MSLLLYLCGSLIPKRVFSDCFCTHSQKKKILRYAPSDSVCIQMFSHRNRACMATYLGSPIISVHRALLCVKVLKVHWVHLSNSPLNTCPTLLCTPEISNTLNMSENVKKYVQQHEICSNKKKVTNTYLLNPAPVVPAGLSLLAAAVTSHRRSWPLGPVIGCSGQDGVRAQRIQQQSKHRMISGAGVVTVRFIFYFSKFKSRTTPLMGHLHSP